MNLWIQFTKCIAYSLAKFAGDENSTEWKKQLPRVNATNRLNSIHDEPEKNSIAFEKTETPINWPMVSRWNTIWVWRANMPTEIGTKLPVNSAKKMGCAIAPALCRSLKCTEIKSYETWKWSIGRFLKTQLFRSRVHFNKFRLMVIQLLSLFFRFGIQTFADWT